MLSSRLSALRLLHSQRGDRVPALAGEHGQQREDDCAAHGHVGREHRAREPLGDSRRHAAQQLSNAAGNGLADIVFTPADADGLRGLTVSARWTLWSRATAAYATDCEVIRLD
jgi:hypothetical protein